MKLILKSSIGALLLGAIGLQACGGTNDEPSKDDDGTIIPPEGGSPNGSGGSASGGSAIGGDSSTGGSPFNPPPPRGDCPAEPDGTQPAGPNAGTACWTQENCNGVSPEQFLERCNSGTCYPFDNDERIEGYTGTLPALP